MISYNFFSFSENAPLFIIQIDMPELQKKKRKNTKENSKKSVKLMESYQMPRNDQDTITDMTSRTSMATVTVSAAISIPTKCSKPFLVAEVTEGAPGVQGVGCMGPHSVSGVDLGAVLFSNLVNNLNCH